MKKRSFVEVPREAIPIPGRGLLETNPRTLRSLTWHLNAYSEDALQAFTRLTWLQDLHLSVAECLVKPMWGSRVFWMLGRALENFWEVRSVVFG